MTMPTAARRRRSANRWVSLGSTYPRCCCRNKRESKMATIRKEIFTAAPPGDAWDALRDVGALHARLVPGFVTGTRLEPGARIVTFGNGMVVRETIVTIDDGERRIVWSSSGGLLTHH